MFPRVAQDKCFGHPHPLSLSGFPLTKVGSTRLPLPGVCFTHTIKTRIGPSGFLCGFGVVYTDEIAEDPAANLFSP